MKDLEFINNPMEWPMWPALPLKAFSPDGFKCAILMAGALKVYLGANLFDLNERPGNTWGEKLKGFETKKYESAEALLAEWRID